MNKSAIKNFAVTARVKLMEAVQQKAYELGITKNEIKEPEVYQEGFRINGKFFKKYQKNQRDKLIQKIKDQGFDQVVEEVAYTWFNRFIAIRFMEVNEYLPTGVRVLSSLDSGKIEPDAVSEVLTIAKELDLDVEVLYRLQDENNTEELFKYTLVKQCNKLGEIMPMMFEQIEDYTELLLPDKLLSEGSVIRDLVSMIEEDNWKEQVEIIGWLYQYYISEKKDQVFADLKKNKKISKENIPAATQLFTPKWIVQYMVENSLGKMWLESHPDEELKKEWKYYLNDAEMGAEVKEQLEKIKNNELSPEEIKVLDPCMGSGHILVYAFDTLYKIYQSAGYSEREIPQLILEKNLYGLDIDDRAAQLAYFALLMKARSYNRRIFRKKLELNVCAIQESNGISEEAIEYFEAGLSNNDEFQYLVNIYEDAKEYGSILDVHFIRFEALEERIENIRSNNEINDLFEFELRNIVLKKLPALIKQAKIMSQKYDVVVTNPPYMGSKGMGEKLYSFVNKHYKLSKTDLYSVFIEKGFSYLKSNGFNSMVTMHSWMFLSSFEKMRKKMLQNYNVTSMVHLGMEAFESIIGKLVQTVAFVIRNNQHVDVNPTYVRLVDYYDSRRYEKEEQFFSIKNRFKNIDQKKYLQIPGYTFAYWISDDFMNSFKRGKNFEEYCELKTGLVAGDNKKYFRMWYEIDFNKIGFEYKNIEMTLGGDHVWFPINHGGNRCKWFGNHLEVVNFYKNADEIRKEKNSMLRNKDYYFKKGMTWNRVGSSVRFAARVAEQGFIFDDVSPSGFVKNKDDYNYLIGFMNTKLFNQMINVINTGFKTEIGHIAKIPIIWSEEKDDLNEINVLVEESISISKKSWDDNELSWGFKKNRLLLKMGTISDNFTEIEVENKRHIQKMVENEKNLNRLFYHIYQINDVDYVFNDHDITIKKVILVKEIKSFFSYAIGNMLGRYSLDQDGLVVADGGFDDSKYAIFKAASTNIIPITDDEYFEDDIVTRFIDFVRVTFGPETLEENLDFITESLTKKENETSRQRIRRYFVKEFYKDHLQTYQKRPVYWLYDSGKSDGFKALIYMHRYDVGNVAKVRTDYLHTLQRKYESEISRLDLLWESDVSTLEKTKAKKQKEKIQKQLLECQLYDQVIAHVANQKIEIDLDDGIKVNYEKFQNIEVPQGEGKKPQKANLLAKI